MTRLARRKVGLRRIDAALDHLSAMGFPRVLVRKTVNKLLKVYDGEWVFLEEASYRVVIEAILEEQYSKQNTKPKLSDPSPSKKVMKSKIGSAIGSNFRDVSERISYSPLSDSCGCSFISPKMVTTQVVHSQSPHNQTQAARTSSYSPISDHPNPSVDPEPSIESDPSIYLEPLVESELSLYSESSVNFDPSIKSDPSRDPEPSIDSKQFDPLIYPDPSIESDPRFSEVVGKHQSSSDPTDMLSVSVGAKVEAIIVFGDSSVDAGNNNHICTILKSNFSPYGRDFYGSVPTGRFSNGRLPSDFISEAFGIKPLIPPYLDPNFNVSHFVNGVCFASAGSGFDNLTSHVLSVIPLWKQLEYYKEFQEELNNHLGKEKAKEVVGESLHLISVGTNDFLENFYMLPKRSSEYSVEEYQKFLLGIAEEFMEELYGMGARKISIVGLPPMGCLPLERTTNFMFGSECVEEYNNVAIDFNGKLEGLVLEMNQKLLGIQLVFANPYDIIWNIIQNPGAFGFEDVERACCGTGLFEMSYMCDEFNPFTCSDANDYVFWDAFHPTQKTYAIIAHYLFYNYLIHFN
ncbi:GDSL esterase/lipase [Senna tora]|uniref:GDSL esterase/lipase n=1 Tax=Senna tora TaxID=362788 RepID=A0A834WB52_9FABA|nr:GDSL esterase/lipase [Senna tora]